MEQHYRVEFIYKGVSYYCIWYSSDHDYLINQENRIEYFSAMRDLETYCLRNKLPLSKDDAAVYNLDEIETWLAGGKTRVDCKLILNVWNIFQDVAFSAKVLFSGNDKTYNGVYNKIFYGNNLPSINTSGKIYVPEWDEEELQVISDVLENGMQLFRKSLIS